MILTGVGNDWRARREWSSLEAFRQSGGYDPAEMVQVQLAAQHRARHTELTRRGQVQVGSDGVEMLSIGDFLARIGATPRRASLITYFHRGSLAGDCTREASAVQLKRKRRRRHAVTVVESPDDSAATVTVTAPCHRRTRQVDAAGRCGDRLYLRNWRFHERNPDLLEVCAKFRSVPLSRCSAC